MEETVRFVPKNASHLEARFLSEDGQRKYEEAVKQFRNERAREVLRIPREGSNLFKVLLLNQIGIRTATLPELDQIVQGNEGFLRGFYTDAPSVVLRSNGDSYEPNHYLAKCFARLIRKRKFREPVVINGLKLVEDNDSAYGLGFNRGKNFDFFEAPELSHENNGRKFITIDGRGMPVFDEKGTRTLYTRPDGLSGFCLSGGSDVDSGSGSLAVSYDSGRVVVVSAEGTLQKIKQGAQR